MTRDWARIHLDISVACKENLDEEGIETPWPHTKVYFGNTLAEQGSANWRAGGHCLGPLAGAAEALRTRT